MGDAPWVDVHAHPGRCFLAGLPPGHDLIRALGEVDFGGAVAGMRAGGMAAVGVATVADLQVLGLTPDGGIEVVRSFADGEAYADHRRQLAAIAEQAAAYGLPIARRAADIVDAHAAGRTAALLTCEGADFVEGRVERLAEAHEAGVRSVTLLHYRANGLGDPQTAAQADGGLTPAGRDVVVEMNRLGLLIDLAHASGQTILDVIEVSSAPVMVSHSHLGEGHPRLISPHHARAVADAGGLVGAWPAGVTARTFGDFVDEIVRLVEVVGVDHVAIGTDMDANYRPVLTRYEQFAAVEAALLDRGFSHDEANRILGGNAVALMSRVCG